MAASPFHADRWHALGVFEVCSLFVCLLRYAPSLPCVGACRPERYIPVASCSCARRLPCSLQEGAHAQAVVACGGASGVKCLFSMPGGEQVVSVLLAPPWASSASAASSIGRKSFLPPLAQRVATWQACRAPYQARRQGAKARRACAQARHLACARGRVPACARASLARQLALSACAMAWGQCNA